MDNPVYLSVQVSMIVLTLSCTALIMLGLRKILPMTGFSLGKQKLIFGRTVITIMTWLLLTALLATSGFLSDFSTMPPRLFLVFVPPLLLMLYITFFSKNIREILMHTPRAWLVYIQTFRIFVEILLWLLVIVNLLPEQMSFAGRNWDILVGLTAPAAAWLWFRGGRFSPVAGVIWNIFGLALLANIVTIAILSMPLPFRVFMNEPTNTIVATFPLVWLPSVLVPIAYSMHFFSLKQVALLIKKEKVQPIHLN